MNGKFMLDATSGNGLRAHVEAQAARASTAPRIASAPPADFGQGMSCLIRAATSDDAVLIHAFVHELATYERCPDQVEATPESLRATLFPADGSPPVARCVIAESDGEPAGFALYFYNYSTWLARPGLYLEDLFVRPAHRGRGIGRALLLHLAQQAYEQGCGRMEWAVLDWNQPAIDFYEKLGAQRLTDWTICRLDRSALARQAGATGRRPAR